MTQRKIDDLFSQKRSRIHPTKVRDEFDEIFESTKRQRTKPSVADDDDADEIFQTKSSLKKKRSRQFDDEQNGQQKKFRCPETTIDLLDMFNTRSNPQVTTIDQDFKVPLPTQKKVQMFFDQTDLTSSSREEIESKDYTQIKPVLITGGQWLSKEEETKSTCQTSEEIPVDERNLMHIQYVPLIIDDEPLPKSSNSNRGKSFHKQLVLSNSNIVREENLQSCYNALLEDVNKPRIKSQKIDVDDGDVTDVDFFDLPSRRKRS